MGSACSCVYDDPVAPIGVVRKGSVNTMRKASQKAMEKQIQKMFRDQKINSGALFDIVQRYSPEYDENAKKFEKTTNTETEESFTERTMCTERCAEKEEGDFSHVRKWLDGVQHKEVTQNELEKVRKKMKNSGNR